MHRISQLQFGSNGALRPAAAPPPGGGVACDHLVSSVDRSATTAQDELGCCRPQHPTPSHSPSGIPVLRFANSMSLHPSTILGSAPTS
ncbi:hypothetical protein CC85DRAFT_283167 [Cutaneotrichosporon oleaginosum]|uniref:Uncharacterized protein n=1 Tax=Cutaneotrichosporon oleaginosum TaxID=879819 RepID=A0A0J0XUT5_9TREE|nr:uncharacterized protein CC85DRAFT_283167 [Cutaneotrichosporon oleaginosum]KLT44866.1 hypothetical protein CC85DRAFT_283167 [Cutaneotrichosporon oleaginosum]TXT11999.1 hypothetical protein COLE_02409 [Cutaneotrichosporon oleaginosum]